MECKVFKQRWAREMPITSSFGFLKIIAQSQSHLQSTWSEFKKNTHVEEMNGLAMIRTIAYVVNLYLMLLNNGLE